MQVGVSQILRNSVLAIVGLLLVPSAAWAAKYECEPAGTFTWQHGKMVPQQLRYKYTFTFDDQTGKSVDHVESPRGGDTIQQFRIVQRAGAGNDVVAIRDNTGETYIRSPCGLGLIYRGRLTLWENVRFCLNRNCRLFKYNYEGCYVDIVHSSTQTKIIESPCP